MKRENGFYWVKFEGEWIIGEWMNSIMNWFLTTTEGYFINSDFEEIDENRLTHE